MIRGVIFDLDLTLIASGEAESHRKNRNWQAVYRLIPKLTPYDGIGELIASLETRNIAIAIVTSSPGTYCAKIVKHWKLPIATQVGFHDAAPRKPHPAPMLKALSGLGMKADDVIAVGDSADDITSARGASIFAVAALWGTLDRQSLLRAKPDAACESVGDLGVLISSMVS